MLKPWKNVEKEKGAWVVKMANEWTPYKKANEYIPQVTQKIEKTLAALSEQGISSEAYHDMEIFILPA